MLSCCHVITLSRLDTKQNNSAAYNLRTAEGGKQPKAYNSEADNLRTAEGGKQRSIQQRSVKP